MMAAGEAGRPAKEPAPITYTVWKSTGSPALKLSVIQLAAWIGITRARVNTFVQRGDLIREHGTISTDHPRNKEWLLDRDGYVPNELQSPGRPRKDAHMGAAVVCAPQQQAPGGGGSDNLDLDVVLEAISRMDLTALSSAAVQKVQRLESALKTRVEREAKRGLLIDRLLVRTVMGKLYAVDSNEMKPLGGRIATDAAIIFGVDDPTLVLKLEQKIDDEILKVLSHIKRIIDDFLVRQGADPVGES